MMNIALAALIKAQPQHGTGAGPRGAAASLGVPGLGRHFHVCGLTRGGCVAWILRLVKIGADRDEPFTDVMTVNRAKAVIVEEVERLHWRLWNGKAKDAQISVDRIRTVMHHFQGEQGGRSSISPSRKLWTALHALDGYLTG